MKRSIVLLAVVPVLLAALALGQEAQKPATQPPAPSERVFFPLVVPSGEGEEGLKLVDPLREYGDVIKEATLVLGRVGELYPRPSDAPRVPTAVQAGMLKAANGCFADQEALKLSVQAAVRKVYPDLGPERVEELAEQAIHSLVEPSNQGLVRQLVGSGPPRPAYMSLMGFTSPWRCTTVRKSGGEPDSGWGDLVPQTGLLTTEPELGTEIVEVVCRELANILEGLELQLAYEAMSEAKAKLQELEKKYSDLQARVKQLEEEHDFRVMLVGGQRRVYIGDKEVISPLQEELAGLEARFSELTLEHAGLQAQLEYVRTTLAKEPQVLQVTQPPSPERRVALEAELELLVERLNGLRDAHENGRASDLQVHEAEVALIKAKTQLRGGETVSTINPAWSALKQRLVEIETEVAGLKARIAFLKPVYGRKEELLNRAEEFLAALPQRDDLQSKVRRTEALVAELGEFSSHIEQNGPVPVSYYVQVGRPRSAEEREQDWRPAPGFPDMSPAPGGPGGAMGTSRSHPAPR